MYSVRHELLESYLNKILSIFSGCATFGVGKTIKFACGGTLN